MNGLELADAVAVRLTSLVPSRTVYAHGVPDGDLPARYLIVWASEGSEESTRMVRTVHVQTPAVWVTSVSRNTSPEVAARESQWGAGKAREALRNWLPESRWAMKHDSSAPARRDESIDATTYVATEQFSLRSTA